MTTRSDPILVRVLSEALWNAHQNGDGRLGLPRMAILLKLPWPDPTVKYCWRKREATRIAIARLMTDVVIGFSKLHPGYTVVRDTGDGFAHVTKDPNRVARVSVSRTRKSDTHDERALSEVDVILKNSNDPSLLRYALLVEQRNEMNERIKQSEKEVIKELQRKRDV